MAFFLYYICNGDLKENIVTTMEGLEARKEAKIYEVFAMPYGAKTEYKVKTAHGIETFRTRKAAEEYAAKAKVIQA